MRMRAAALLLLAGCDVADPEVEAAKEAVRAAHGADVAFGDLWHGPELAPEGEARSYMPRLAPGVCGEFRPAGAAPESEPRRFLWIPRERWLLEPDARGHIIFENDRPLAEPHEGVRTHPQHRYLDWAEHCRRHHR